MKTRGKIYPTKLLSGMFKSITLTLSQKKLNKSYNSKLITYNQ